VPVAGDIKLTMTADAQDAASAKLRMVQAELGKTAQAVREAKSATAEDHEVEQLLIRAKDRRLKLAAEDRRESVLAARATRDAADAKGKLATGFDSVSDKARGFHQAQLKLNEILGVAGFIGAIGGAVIGLIKLIDSMSQYGRAMADVKAQQADFNKLMTQLEDAGFAELIDQMNAGWVEGDARLVIANKRLDEWRDKYVDAGHKVEVLNHALAANDARRQRAAADAETSERRGLAAGMANKLEIRKLDTEHNKLLTDIRRAKEAEAGMQAMINRLLREATPEYWQHADAAAKLTKENKAIVDAAQVGIAAAKKAGDEAHDKSRAAASAGASNAKAQADRIRGLERELQLTKTHGEIERTTVEMAQVRDDLAAKRISKREAELSLAIKRASIEQKITEHQDEVAQRNEEKRKGDLDRVRSLQEELAIAAALNESDKARIQLEQELARIEREKKSGAISGDAAGLEGQLARGRFKKEQEARDRDAAAKQVEKIGAAAEKTAAKIAMLSGRMSGLAPAIAGGTQLWTAYEKGTLGVGEALAGTIGVMGEATASGISNKKEAALVEGIFEQFAAIASFAAMDYKSGIEHEAASVGFFGLAAQGGGGKGGGGGGGGASSGGSSSAPAPPTSGRSTQDTRPVVQVVYGRGIVYGMGAEVAKANASTNESLRGTGMQRRRY